MPMLTINIPHLNLNQLVEDIKDRGTDSFTSRFSVMLQKAAMFEYQS